ncbi:uncharacterized protein LOC143626584 [Bidens hawaiensis]|uniref:uncharacterized protein LOC143626584 n=1 Tax=Bidens hawaiensis TaxID=980011 RepID=UPI004049C2FB
MAQICNKRQRTLAWNQQSFPPTNPHNKVTTLVIVEAELNSFPINGAYMDYGATMEVMYERCFLELPQEIKKQLQHTENSLKSFTGEKVIPLGKLTLDVQFRDGDLSRVEKLTFIVVRHPSNYNILIGTTGIATFDAVVSTAHGMIKFPTTGEIATMVLTPKDLLLATTKESWELDEDMEDSHVQDISISPAYPEKTIKVNSTLISLLQNSKDVFAWCPIDMIGVPKEYAEHSLNISPTHKPFSQRKRSLETKRSLAVCNEVDKLIKANILQEVRHHSWISHPVMVKKSEGSWRMRVDFKDLNKSCPKDRYPLPKIDWKIDYLTGF